VDPLVAHPKQHLPRTPEFLELAEDEPDDFLNPKVRVEVCTAVAIPHEADRNGNAQLSPTGFRPSCFHQARTQNAVSVLSFPS